MADFKAAGFNSQLKDRHNMVCVVTELLTSVMCTALEKQWEAIGAVGCRTDPS